MSKYYLNLLLLFGSVCITLAQDSSNNTNPNLPDVNSIVKLPNSPEAEAFLRYGNVPVSYYTGKPDISIPIYTLEGREKSIPISLTYDASGIKVQSISTNVGAGWNLNVGGMVTRQVMHLPDDLVNGNTDYDINSSLVKSFNAYLASLRDSAGNYLNFESYEHDLYKITNYLSVKAYNKVSEIDLMPDIFSFNAPGLSGSVVINPANGQAVSIDNPDIQVSYTRGFANSIISWQIIDSSGVIYFFNKAEETNTSYSTEVAEGTRVYNSAWYLTKIETQTKKDIFEFEYSYGVYWDQPQLYYNRQIWTHDNLYSCSSNSIPNLTTPFVQTSTYTDFRIKQSNLLYIKRNGKLYMNFTYIDDRLDLKGRKTLNKINVHSPSNLIKTFQFNYSYFTASTTPTDEEDYRLKLDEILVEAVSQSTTPVITTEPMRYSFDYYGDSILPSRKSLAIDHLGYYNGKTNNQSLIPEYNHSGVVFPGADRNSNFNFLIKGMLKEIHYPTGGSTEFVFSSIIDEIPQISNNPDTVSEVIPYYKQQHLTSIGGGTNYNSNESDYSCDDGFWYMPHTKTVSFSVNDDQESGIQDFYFNTSQSGNYSQSGRVFFVAIYKDNSGRGNNSLQGIELLDNGCILYTQFGLNTTVCPEECNDTETRFRALVTICFDELMDILNSSTNSTNNDKTFCDIHSMIQNNNSNLIYHSYDVPLPSGYAFSLGKRRFDPSTQNLFYIRNHSLIPPGNYKLFIANSFEGISTSVSRGYFTFNSSSNLIDYRTKLDIPIVSKIIDKTNEGAQYIKEFEYLDFDIKQKISYEDFKTVYNRVASHCFRGEVTSLERYSNNLYSQTPQIVTFSKVKEIRKDNLDNDIGSTLYEFHDQSFLKDFNLPPSELVYPVKRSQTYIKNYPLMGSLKKVSHFDFSGKILKKEESIYNYQKQEVTTGSYFYSDEYWDKACVVASQSFKNPNLHNLAYLFTTNSPYEACASNADFDVLQTWVSAQEKSDHIIPYYSFKTQLLKKKTTDYVYDASANSNKIVQNTEYVYGLNHNLPVKIKFFDSNGGVRENNVVYPKDLDFPTPAEQRLIEQHRIETPIRTETIVEDINGNELSKQVQRTNYKDWGNNQILPKSVQTLKGTTTSTGLEDRVVFHRYDASANPLEISKKDGMHTVYLYGYSKQYPIAQIQNATFAEVATALGVSEDALENFNEVHIGQINGLRATKPKWMITTYIHIPLVGVKTITDPRGRRTNYEYDDFNRLKHIKDHDGNILEAYDYHYKTENP